MIQRQKFCIVRLGKYSLGFNVQFVRSVHEVMDSTPLPMPVPYVVGVINLRGQVISLFDTYSICKLPSTTEQSARKTFLFLECTRGNGGLVVDQINDVIEVDTRQLHPPQSNFNPALRSFVSSVLSYNDDLILILDFEKIYDMVCGG